MVTSVLETQPQALEAVLPVHYYNQLQFQAIRSSLGKG